jgi:predicted GIY-YIG superfamily endonuclease
MDDWRDVGEIKYESGKILLPQITNEPGVYRLTFDDGSVYIGETATLNERLGAYHSPGQGVEAEFRLQQAIKEHSPVTVSIMLGEHLDTRSKRCVIESRLIKEIKEQKNCRLLNGGTIEGKIAFYESEIARLRKKLESSSASAALEPDVTTR